MFNENYYFWAHNGTLAQLVQSACLTGKRSLVRFQYAPQKNKRKQTYIN